MAHKNSNDRKEKQSLAETFFQKLFGKRRAVDFDDPGGPGPDLGLAGRFLGMGRFLAGSWDLGRLFDFGVDLRYFSFFRFEWF